MPKKKEYTPYHYIEKDRVYHLHMDEFVPPEQRIDAFPSMKYQTDPIYSSDSFTISCPIGMDATIFIDQRPVYLSAFDILILAPYVQHKSHLMDQGKTMINVSMRPGRIHQIFPRLFDAVNPIGAFLENSTKKDGPLYLHLHTGRNGFDGKIFEQLMEHCMKGEDGDPLTLLLLENQLEALLLSLARQMQTEELHPAFLASEQNTADKLAHILGYLQANLANADLNGTAKALGWSPAYLSRYLKQHTGRSFTDILQTLRLDEAASMLAHSNLPIDEIMFLTGYHGKANFYDIFHKRFLTTPAGYRKKQNRA